MWFFRKNKISYYERLAEKWLTKQRSIQENLWQRHGNILKEYVDNSKKFAVGSLAGMLLLFGPGSPTRINIPFTAKEKPLELDNSTKLILDLQSSIPNTVRPLNPTEEKNTEEILSRYIGIPVNAQLNGIRLNTTYGIIGQEQHLYRYPGDTLNDQFSTQQEYDQFASFGIAPGLGAYGYFASSKNAMTPKEADREKWYIAVQTFLSPGYNKHTATYNNFFKFRKMLVVNPENGKAVIADIGDAGPGQYIGKQLGGSPEVMHYLERVDGAKKGPVLYFFINDPMDKIPLGPIQNS